MKLQKQFSRKKCFGLVAVFFKNCSGLMTCFGKENVVEYP